MQQHELIPNNTGQKEANHRRLHSLCFPFYKVIGNVKLFTKAYTGGKAIEKIKEMIINKSGMVISWGREVTWEGKYVFSEKLMILFLNQDGECM